MFAVVEIQKNGTSAVPLTSLFENKDDAYSKYHQVLAAAAKSTVQEHSAILISEEGAYLIQQKFIHEAE